VALTLPPLIDPPALAEALESRSGILALDATVELVRPPGGGRYTVVSGRAEYDRAHIPGALFADIPGELSDPESPFPFSLPTAERFAEGAGALGVGPGTHVVVYAQTSPMWATRLWWQLRFFGFDAVSVLDGGLPAWRAAALPVDDRQVTPRPATLTARPRPELLANRIEIERLVGAGDGATCLVNALTPRVFRGEGVSSYSRAGRIPGSVNAPWTSLIDPDTNRFREPSELREALESVGALAQAPVIAYCGGGISATVDLFALSLLGRGDARLYDGSLTEWTANPSLPVELG
jgi:thiosulfate/3-mercaptopyruvate sulfurtransferase